jgi:hypothetical protein
MVGIAVRTNNSREAGPNDAIPRTWQAFYRQRLGERIRGKADGDMDCSLYKPRRRAARRLYLHSRNTSAARGPDTAWNGGQERGEGSIHVDKNQARTRGTRCARRVASYLEVRGSRSTGRDAKLLLILRCAGPTPEIHRMLKWTFTWESLSGCRKTHAVCDSEKVMVNHRETALGPSEPQYPGSRPITWWPYGLHYAYSL